MSDEKPDKYSADWQYEKWKQKNQGKWEKQISEKHKKQGLWFSWVDWGRVRWRKPQAEIDALFITTNGPYEVKTRMGEWRESTNPKYVLDWFGGTDMDGNNVKAVRIDPARKDKLIILMGHEVEFFLDELLICADKQSHTLGERTTFKKKS